MRKYRFHFLESQNPDFEEKDHIIFAEELEDAIRKFERKHDIQAPAYWDAPSFDTSIEIYFKDSLGFIRYLISWS